MTRISVFDTTLRDGELTDGVRFTTEDRIAIASSLAACGVDVIEVAVAGASGAQMDAVRAVAREVRTSKLCVLAAATSDAIDAAGAALRDAAAARIHVYEANLEGNEALESVDRIVCRAKRYVDDVEFTAVQGVTVGLEAVVAATQVALRAGACTISIADTAGRTLPDHDDLGLATANTLAAVLAGVRQVEVAVNGLGARAGNAALEEVVAAIHEHGAALGAETRVDIAALASLSRLVEERSRVAVSAQKSVVGPRAHWLPKR